MTAVRPEARDTGCERLARGAAHCVQLPIGPLFRILAGPIRGRGVGYGPRAHRAP